MILKPLNGFGGSGVILIEKRAMKSINSLLDFYIDNKDGTTAIIFYDYNEDVRLLIWQLQRFHSCRSTR